MGIALALVACGGGDSETAAPVTAVQAAPVISAQPGNTTVSTGAPASFAVTATGSALQYQWEVSGDAGASWTAEPGANQASLLLAATTLGQSGRQYRVVVTNPGGNVTSNPAQLTVMNPSGLPFFSVQPVGASVEEGQIAAFTVAAGGTPAPTLEWEISRDNALNWINIAGDLSSITVSGSAVVQDQLVRAIATNAQGSATSIAVPLRTRCDVGRLELGNPPSPAATVFCPQVANSFTSPGVNTVGRFWVEVYGFGNGAYAERVGVTINTSQQVIEVFYYLNDPTRLLSAFCSPCTGVTHDPGTGTVTFVNTPVSLGGPPYVLNGILRYTP